MKQLLSLFLFLLPCLALAQYPTNGNQKITLGEQTSADGLVYRGVLADTGIITPSSDTSAYIILDTVNHRFYNYNRATNVWSMAGVGSISSGLTGVLPVANGGTGQNTLTANKVLVGNGTTGILSPNNLTYSNEVLNLGTNVNAELRLPERGQSIRMENSSLSITLGGAGLFISNNSIASKSLNNTLVKNTAEASSFIGMRYDRGIHFSTNIPGTVNTTFPDDTLNRMMIALNGNVGIGTTFFGSPPTEKLHVVGNGRFTGNIAVGVTSATARLHLASGTATASTAPLKFTSGTNLTTAEAGAMEFNGTNLLFSPSTTRHTVNHGLTGSATLDFLSTNAQNSRDLTISVTGAADGDVVSLGVPNAAVNANTSYSAWVSAANTVTVRFNNYSSGTVDPASGSFKVFVTK
jgi:hypothetical protein